MPITLIPTQASTPALNNEAESPALETSSHGPETNTLFSDKNAHISHYLAPTQGVQYSPLTAPGLVQITTMNTSDTINVTVGTNNQINAYINGKCYKLPLSANGAYQKLVIEANGGNDRICIDPRVQIETTIMGGDGDDLISAGSGLTRIEGGRGKDYIRLGSGFAVAHGGDGDDVMLAGTGNASLSGGKGDDRLYALYPNPKASLRQVFLNGDGGNDQLFAGTGRVVMNGGTGDDTMVGHHQTTFYAGAGNDTLRSYSAQDKIYAKKTDHIDNCVNAPVQFVNTSDAGKRGLAIEEGGSFAEQTEAYIEQLRGSPAGQKMLEALDKLVDKTKKPITLSESDSAYRNSYHFNNEYSDNFPEDADLPSPYPAGFGFITDAAAGSIATRGEVTFVPDFFEEKTSTPPLLTLYHELAHAYNGGTGTLMPGSTPIKGNDGKPVMVDGQPVTVENREYQAIGLPNEGPAFDFDGNSDTPPTTTNPWPLTENALREEMGIPLRERYKPEDVSGPT